MEGRGVFCPGPKMWSKNVTIFEISGIIIMNHFFGFSDFFVFSHYIIRNHVAQLLEHLGLYFGFHMVRGSNPGWARFFFSFFFIFYHFLLFNIRYRYFIAFSMRTVIKIIFGRFLAKLPTVMTDSYP